MAISFVIPGKPVPKGRPRVVKMRGRSVTFTPAETVAYEKKVRFHAVANGIPYHEGDVVVSIALYMPTARRVDIDNLAKGILDALNGAAWYDDSQVCELHVRREIDRENPRAVVTLEAA